MVSIDEPVISDEQMIKRDIIVLEKAVQLGQIKRADRISEYADFLLGIIFSMSILYKIRDRESLRVYIDEQLALIE